MKFTKAVIALLLSATINLPAYSASSIGSGGISYSAERKKPSLLSGAEKYIDRKHYEEAIRELKHVVSEHPKNADAYNLLGYTHRKLTRYEAAEQYYFKALELKPKHKGALEYLGELYVETNRMDKAYQMLERLDNACFFRCKEYKMLQAVIESKQQSAKLHSHE